MNESFDSEFCSVTRPEGREAVLLSWKQPATGDAFREPFRFARELLSSLSHPVLLIDPGDGFCPEVEDAEWLDSSLLPELSKTGCRKAALLLREEAVPDAEQWRTALGCFFAVWTAAFAEEALRRMEQLIWVDVAYTVKPEKRDELYAKIEEQGIVYSSRREPGNYRYDYVAPMDRPGELWITEVWTGAEAQKAHAATESYARLLRLKSEYVEQTVLRKFTVSEL